MPYPWARTEAALRQITAYGGQTPAELDDVNPETGTFVLPTMGFTAMMLAKDDRISLPLTSSAAVFHVIQGKGDSTIGG